MTKTKISFLITIMLIAVLALSLPALAENDKQYIEETAMYITLPGDGDILTRDITDDHQYLVNQGMTAATLTADFRTKNIYLEYINNDPAYKIDIIKFSVPPGNDFPDFGERTEEELDQLAAAMMGDIDPTAISYQLTTVNDIKYIVFDYQYQVDSQDVYVQAYYTTHHSQQIYVCLYSAEPPSETMTSQLADSVESIEFGEPQVMEGLYLEELYMFVSMPDDAYTVTRDLTEDDPILDYFATTKEAFQEELIARNVYLSYFNPHGYQIDVYMTAAANDSSPDTHDFGDMNDLTESKLDKYAQQTSNTLAKNAGLEVANYGVVAPGAQKFVLLDYTEITEDETYYVRSYHTYINDQDIFIDLYAFGEPLTEDMLAQMDEVIVSIGFLGMDAAASTELQAADIGKILRQEVSTTSAPISLFGLSLQWLLIIGGAILAIIIVIVIFAVKKSKKGKDAANDAQAPPASEETAAGEQTDAVNDDTTQTQSQNDPEQIDQETKE